MTDTCNPQASFKRNIFIGAITAYAILLHVVVAYLILDPNSTTIIQKTFGTPDQEAQKYYNRMSRFYKRIDANIKPGAVLFIGDSHIQGLCVTCVSSKAVNFGIGRDTTYGVYKRLRDYQSIYTASSIILEVGINDFPLKTTDDIIDQYTEIINAIPSNIHIVLSAIMPIDSEFISSKDRSNTNIQILNKGLQSICASYKNCTFVDIGKKIQDKNGDLSDHYHIGDGIHLSPNGYEIWIKDLKNALSQQR